MIRLYRSDTIGGFQEIFIRILSSQFYPGLVGRCLLDVFMKDYQVLVVQLFEIDSDEGSLILEVKFY